MFTKRSCFRVTVVRNAQRQERSLLLTDVKVQNKVNYARQFVAKNVISEDNLAYTTQPDLLEQESEAIALHCIEFCLGDCTNSSEKLLH